MTWNRRFAFREFLRNSLWLLPVVGLVIGVILRFAVVRIERRWPAPESLTFSADAATTILTSIVAAMISFTGFVLTILVLVIQFTGASFSPRALLFIFRDPQLKLSLGLFVGTTVYAFMLLTYVSEPFVPSWGVLLAGALVLISMMLFLQFLSHLLHGIRPANLAHHIGNIGHEVIGREYPRPAPPDGEPLRIHVAARPAGDPSRVVRKAGKGETIQAIDIQWLIADAERRGVVYVLPNTVGNFVSSRGVLFEIFGSSAGASDDELRSHIAMGTERTVDQDPAFPLRVVADIAVKALSAAINDPTTGTNALDVIEDLLVDLAGRDLESGVYRDRSGSVRLIVHTPAWEDFLQIGVTEIRLYGATSMQTMRRLAALLERLLKDAPHYRLLSIHREMDLVHRSISQVFIDSEDREMAVVPDSQGIGSVATFATEPSPGVFS